ncbi:hypothetical protein L227DRAFT_309593 [Lentinus tigrinus ALCF2SS1-6]|uniref:Methyltransferase domain-containing protein n=1 Tax=Lentinus tigrinus ALCF2SS1-6 TaxID=1328759 RepID=A0A5C2RWS5_9APHY|nr:hypothetical protein L227DRAFT_309593 [Lentinus tigrinus ALCF2SS1-6]
MLRSSDLTPAVQMSDETKPTVNFRNILPVDGTEGLLQLDGDRLDFFRSTTGIHDVEELKKHIVAVQRAAYKTRPYPCIVNFNFAQLRLSRIAQYGRLLELGKSREHPILLDVGCCLGTDLQKLIADGYPRECVIATDIVPEFWELGHKLFNTTPETFPVPFVPGDIFDPSFLEPTPPIYGPPTTPVPNLSSVRTLTELRGHVSAITICAVFHVFETEEVQLKLARALASLLSPAPGSMIVGLHRGLLEKGIWQGQSFKMFSHSPESWADMWDGVVFEKGTVTVEARLVQKQRKYMQDGVQSEKPLPVLEWSVTRV